MALLNILGYKLKDDYKSLQYLYHAVVQEEHLLRNLRSVGLTRNPKATKIHGDEASAYWYLFSDYSDIGTKTVAPDFKFNDDYTIDAKIYGSEDSMQNKLNREVVHNADFVIVYLMGGTGAWKFLYKTNDGWKDWIETNGAELITDLAVNALAQKVYQLKQLHFKYKI